MVTRPFVLEGDKLQVNVDALDGYVIAELLEASGKPIPGFSGGSAKVYRGFDNLRLEPIWTGDADLSSLRGKEVRLQVPFEQCEVVRLPNSLVVAGSL